MFIWLIPVFGETQISDKVVILTTQSGEIVIELFPTDAPKTVENFLKLTEQKFYDRTVFHRIIKDFMIQGGDPKTKPGGYTHLSEWGTGDAGYTIPGEFNTIKHKRGIVSMARGGDPDSGSSQFFIVDKDTPSLDQNYAVFGRLATKASYDTLDKIANLETTGNEGNNIAYDWGKGEILKAEVKNRSDIPDILDQGEPERVSPKLNEQTPYHNDKLGFSFVPPQGWLVQEPQKQNSDTPDIVVVGDKIGGFTPHISITVVPAKTTLEVYNENLIKNLKPGIDSGILSIQKQEKVTINGNEAFVIEASNKFNNNEGQIKVKFKQVIIHFNDKFYIWTYANSENNFETTLPKFTASLESLSFSNQPGQCAIATASYGTEQSPQIQLLREIRDNSLYQTNSGTAFMVGFNEFYYSFSPTIADWERQNPLFKEFVKITITPMLSTLSILNYVDIQSEQQILGYGIGIILLNAVIYFGIPVIVIISIRKKFKKSIPR